MVCVCCDSEDDIDHADLIDGIVGNDDDEDHEFEDLKSTHTETGVFAQSHRFIQDIACIIQKGHGDDVVFLRSIENRSVNSLCWRVMMGCVWFRWFLE